MTVRCPAIFGPGRRTGSRPGCRETPVPQPAGGDLVARLRPPGGVHEAAHPPGGGHKAAHPPGGSPQSSPTRQGGAHPTVPRKTAEFIKHFRTSGRSSFNRPTHPCGVHPAGPHLRAEPWMKPPHRAELIKQSRTSGRNSFDRPAHQRGVHPAGPHLRAEPWMKPPHRAELIKQSRASGRVPSRNPAPQGGVLDETAPRGGNHAPEPFPRTLRLAGPAPVFKLPGAGQTPASGSPTGLPTGALAGPAPAPSMRGASAFSRGTALAEQAGPAMPRFQRASPLSAMLHRSGAPAGTRGAVSRRRGGHGLAASAKGRRTSHGNGIILVISSNRAGQRKRLFRAA